MRFIVSSLIAAGCLAFYCQSASCQSSVASTVGDAPPPPMLKKTSVPTPAPAVAETTKDPAPELGEGDTLKVTTSLITVPAQVMDRNGRSVGNLKQQDFLIFENGVQQELSYFGSVEQPFTVALMLDVSGSTQSRLQAIRAAANAFISRLRPNDKVMLISFDGKINILTNAVTVDQLRRLHPRLDAVNDGTLLYDAVDEVLNRRLAGIAGRKAIVMLTDGVDQGSRRASRKQNLHDANESDVLFYTVQYNTLAELPQRLAQFTDLKVRTRLQARMEKDYEVGGAYLRTLADETGGRLYNADSLSDIQQSFGAIMDDMGRQYSLGYYPKGESKTGERRDIKVRVRIPNLVVRARESYIAGAAPAPQAPALTSVVR